MAFIKNDRFLLVTSLKNGALIMAFVNYAFAIFFLLGCSICLAVYKADEDNSENRVYYICGIFMGLLNLIAGIVLTSALIKGSERRVLYYLIIQLTNLMILTIFSGINVWVKHAWLVAVFLPCLALWVGLYNMLGFYYELRDYNAVDSGVIEISYNAHANPMCNFPEKAIDSTSV